MINKKHYVIEDSDDSDDKTNDYTSQYNNNEIVIPNNHHRLNNDNKNEIAFLNDDEFTNDKNYYSNDNDNMEKANPDVARLKKIIGEFWEILIMNMWKIYSSMHIILVLNRVPLIQKYWRKV